MKFEEIGEIFYDGRIINLDNPSIDMLNSTLENIKIKKDELNEKLDNLVVEMQ